jgi:pimeloyl-ACP methyl ester carboxylesterase
VDASGWKSVAEFLATDGFNVTMVQEPETSFQYESGLGKKTPSVLGKTQGAIKSTPDGFTYLDPSAFTTLFAPDIARARALFMQRSQVLAAAKVFSTPLNAAAWKTKPSWGIVAGDDKIINPDLERWYYARAKSRTTEIKGASHVVFESHPKEVAAVIADAARSFKE